MAILEVTVHEFGTTILYGKTKWNFGVVAGEKHLASKAPRITIGPMPDGAWIEVRQEITPSRCSPPVIEVKHPGTVGALVTAECARALVEPDVLYGDPVKPMAPTPAPIYGRAPPLRAPGAAGAAVPGAPTPLSKFYGEPVPGNFKDIPEAIVPLPDGRSATFASSGGPVPRGYQITMPEGHPKPNQIRKLGADGLAYWVDSPPTEAEDLRAIILDALTGMTKAFRDFMSELKTSACPAEPPRR